MKMGRIVVLLSLMVLAVGMSCMPPFLPGGPISQPRVKVVSFTKTDYQVNSLYIKDNLLFVAEREGGFSIYDISNPSNPSLISHTQPSGLSIDKIMVYGDVLYAGTGMEPYRFVTFDISDPKHPRKLGSLKLMGPAFAIDAWGADCYINESGIFALELIDISNPAKPSVVTEVEGGSNDLKVYQNYIFTVGDSLCIWQKVGSDSIQPLSCNQLDKDITGNALALGYNCAYIATTQGLLVYEIADFRRPREVFRMKFNNPAYGMDIQDRYLYIANYQEGLKVFGLEKPKTPRFIAAIKVPGLAFDVKSINNFVFVGSDSGVTVVEVRK